MSSKYHNNHQNAFTKWMLAVVLLLSFFAFSTPVAQSQVKREVQQTALVVNSPARLVKCINFNKVSRVSNIALEPAVFAAHSFLNVITLHARQVNRCLKKHTNHRLGCASGFLVSHIKTIPQNSSDDYNITLG